MKKIIYTLSIIALGVSMTSCKSFLDINTDPNAPAVENITSDMIFPGAEMNLAATYGNLLRIPSGYFAMYYSQQFGTSNYLDYSQFQQNGTRPSSAYQQLFQKVITNSVTVMEKAAAQQEWGTLLAATTLKAFAYATLVDFFGEVPYTEAMNDNITAPKYDNGDVVYKGVIAELDAALANASSANLVCTNFLFPGESAENWIKFANALKLRMLTRMSNVMDVKDQLKPLIEEGNFPQEDVAYAGCWAEGSGLESPFYSEEFSTNFGSNQTNVVANIAVVGSMQFTDEADNDYLDGRLEKYFRANNSGKYIGAVSGDNYTNATSDIKSAAVWCRPVASYDMPVSLISVADVNFYIAEYYARANDHTTAESYYQDAVEASFDAVAAEGCEEFLAMCPYDKTNWKKSIGVAKWLANAGVDPVEGYTELRRLDYPAFGKIQGSDLYSVTSGVQHSELYVPFTLYTPNKVFEHVGANKLLERFPYASSSSSRNPNCPEFTNADYVKPIFWGK